MRRIWVLFLCSGLLFLFVSQTTAAEEEVKKIGEIQVTAPREDTGVVLAPEATVIDVETYETPGITQNVVDILKDRAIVDFRGESSLVPDDDTIFLRGFDASRFTTALDSLTVEKTGGRQSSHIVDYALLPTFLIDKIEILPGPHSALYPGKSIGGVVNLVTKRPQKYPSVKPEAHVSTSYASYDTQHHNMTVRGGVDAFNYDLAFDKYYTDGFLRNNEADIDTWFGRLGYTLPSDGFITVSASYSDADRQVPVNNDPTSPTYDPDYPEVTSSSWEPSQEPTWDKEAYNYRLNFEQLSPIGLWTAGAYSSKENRQRNYWELDQSAYTAWETIWWQDGARIQDKVDFSENHATTVGYEIARLFDNGPDYKEERVRSQGAYAQHEWTIIPRLHLTAGLRYENVKIRVQNYSTTGGEYITGRGQWIERAFDDLAPKSFLTYEFDDLSSVLRDTSLSVGVSRIWHAPDYHGVYNGQGIPSGAWLEPEHGIGYDVILERRLFKDMQLKLGYSFYEIKDYIASNRDYDKFDPRGGNRANVPFGQEYKDYKINLEEVHRHGVEVELGGHVLDRLSLYLTYSWQDFVNKGNEPAGEEELDQRAEHRITAGLRYNLLKNTILMLDYRYQSDEVTEVAEEVAPDIYEFTDVQIDPYHVVDIGVEQVLFDDWGPMKRGRLKFFVNNVFDEEYQEASGYPAPDQVYGAALAFGF